MSFENGRHVDFFNKYFVCSICRFYTWMVDQRNDEVRILNSKERHLPSREIGSIAFRISLEDKLPKRICSNCFTKLNTLYQFYNKAVNSENQLLEWFNESATENDNETFLDNNVDTEMSQDNSEVEVKEEELSFLPDNDLEQSEANDDLPQEAPQEPDKQNVSQPAEARREAPDSAGVGQLFESVIEGVEMLKIEMYKHNLNQRATRLSLNAQMELVTALKQSIEYIFDVSQMELVTALNQSIAYIFDVQMDMQGFENIATTCPEDTSDDTPTANNDKENT